MPPPRSLRRHQVVRIDGQVHGQVGQACESGQDVERPGVEAPRVHPEADVRAGPDDVGPGLGVLEREEVAVPVDAEVPGNVGAPTLGSVAVRAEAGDYLRQQLVHAWLVQAGELFQVAGEDLLQALVELLQLAGVADALTGRRRPRAGIGTTSRQAEAVGDLRSFAVGRGQVRDLAVGGAAQAHGGT